MKKKYKLDVITKVFFLSRKDIIRRIRGKISCCSNKPYL